MFSRKLPLHPYSSLLMTSHSPLHLDLEISHLGVPTALCPASCLVLYQWMVHTVIQESHLPRVPFVAQQKCIQLGTMRLQVRSLAWRSGLRIQCCPELWCRWHMPGCILCCCGHGTGQQPQF